MNNSEIARLRLHSQRLSSTTFKTADEVVRYLGAVQSQDYAGAKWALGQRMLAATDAALDAAFHDGSFLRTHLLRPTWHFVSPEDIRWMLKLTAPRVHAVNAFMYRQLELDKATIKKSYAILQKSLRGNKQLTRTELGSALAKAGITAERLRLGYIMMSAELDGIICSGARRGKQFTYALLEERVPHVKEISRDEALAELVKRYFSTRGPATLQDFMWWSGLTLADAKQGIEMVKSEFQQEAMDRQTYWFPERHSETAAKSSTVYLLPNYDEYFIGFRDRSAIGELAAKANIAKNDPTLFDHITILDGQVAGGWKRTLAKNKVIVELSPITKLTKPEKQAVATAAERYGRFLGLAVEILWKK
ncbi:MAG TPA: winged helix DNA-binding domain-containing protein [Anaerolineales bacterium]|nr:winged helix DNA-binding domain-containing protein [Anaerolineales bacterium]